VKRPDAVIFNEACSGDVALIARRTGYHVRFPRVIYHGTPLLCVRPGGRGLFGDAVLTKAAIERTKAGLSRRKKAPRYRSQSRQSRRVASSSSSARSIPSFKVRRMAALGPGRLVVAQASWGVWRQAHSR
jgi:hypothetical protein